MCVCSHEELVTVLASSKVQLTGTFLKKNQLTSKVRLVMSQFSFILIVRRETRELHEIHLRQSYSFGSGAVAGILKFSNIP